MPISALPTPPSRSDSPQDFSDRADALLGALPGFVTEANALQSDVNAKEASASSHATIATNKAAEAQASATTASTKASEAAASAVAAAAAASNAEIAFDSFDDKYLGSKASDPTTDNDGNALLVGALYWNTTVGAVRVWNGSSWLSMAADASIVDFQQSGAGAVARTVQDKLREVVSVLDFGADPTGVVDSTAAFNLATMASAAHGGNDDLAMRRVIYVPPGDYRINGTVYVRKGQMLCGAGDGATRILPAVDLSTGQPTFKLGFGTPSGVETQDPGGLPPVIEKLHTMGSHTGGCVVDMHVAGAQARDMFITSCSVGISLGGGDTVISNIIFDQGGDGIRVTGQNHIIDSCLFFLMDTGIRVLDNNFDVQINNCHFEYSLADDITFTSWATQIKNVSIQNCQFVKNLQYAESNQAIYILSAGADVFVHGCEFRNQRSYSIAIRNGVGNNLRVSNCVFDGNKTNPVYSQSTTAAGVLVQNGYVEITNCRFENLYSDPITINGVYDFPVTIKGCSYRNISNATSFVNIAATAGDVTITDCVGDGVLPLINLQSNIRPRLKNNSRWLGAAGNSGGRFFWKIPTTGAANVQVGIVANTLPGGSASYRQASVFFASRYIDYSGSAAADYATKSTIYATPGGIGPAVDAQVELDAVSGGTSGAYSGQGRYLVVSVPVTYTATEIEAEFMV